MDLLLYGLQRSGTNYVEKILTDRYRVNIANCNEDRTYPGCKHFRLYDNKKIVPEPNYLNDIKIKDYASFEKQLKDIPDYCIVISKDPYSWLLSYEKWALICNWGKVNHHYIEEYNLFYGKWLELSSQTDKIVFVRYIDLLRDLRNELRRLKKMMGLRMKISGLFATSRYNLVPVSEAFTQEHFNYYLKEQYLSKYSQERLNEVNSHLDHNVMTGLGYVVRRTV